jgi:hypothetical protein
LIDFDSKGMRDAVKAFIADAGGVWQALLSVVTGLATAARVARTSTSGGLSHAHTGEQFPGSGGEHHYILVENGGDIGQGVA